MLLQELWLGKLDWDESLPMQLQTSWEAFKGTLLQLPKIKTDFELSALLISVVLIFVARGKPPYKSYVALFVCFASKAVHLELVSDLTTDAFLLALQRFVSRRGIPEKVWWDNATNVVGADRHMREFQARLEEQGAVSQHSHQEEDAILRLYRPEHLTSADFGRQLHPQQRSRTKSPACDDGAVSRLSQRWSWENVSSLQANNKWHQEVPNVAVGALVVVAEDNLPPQQWMIGRIVAVNVGADGKVRVADVKTKDTTYRRAVHRLAVLPVAF
ncbi:uncharacterized protein [Drosophila takahashii]|uniref:uncharacterized protein n=1 Tax=Drosophila takahashii TaxID=29030 RepID=UPI003898E191